MPPTDNLPKVSVIIPTYNRADLIGDAIRSVINQTYPNWELIVVDDGSTDDTARVVAGFGERIRYIYQDNAGVCSARNLGFAESQGEFITFLDSDDCMLPHNIEILHGLLGTRSDVDIAYGWGYFYRQENNQRNLMDYQRIQGEIPHQLDQPWAGVDGIPGGASLEGQILPQLLLEDSMLLGANLIRRACVDAVGGFDTSISYMEHWDFYLRLAQAGFTYACSRQAVMLYRNHVGNRFRDAALMLQDRLTVLNRIFADPAWKSRLVNVRNRAYFLAYFENSLACFSYGSLDLGVQSLNAALDYTRILPDELTQLAGCIAKRIIDESTVDALGFTDELFIKIDQTAQASLLRKKVMALVHMSLAFRDYRSGDSRIASRHALAAIRHDLSMWRNRGLVRVLIDGLGGASILDWGRSRRQRLIKNLASILADRPCIFISPHFDDVVLSCGGTLAQLSKIDASILLVTVFTADHNDQMSLSPLAQRMHELWGGYPKPFEVRKDEDKAAAEYLDAEYRWLEFPDVIYRYQTLQENEILQPMFNPRGDGCFESVRTEVLHILNDYPDGIVFVPLGVGYHRDHLIVHEAVKDAAQMAETRCTLIFYEDFPYAVLSDTKQRLSEISAALEPFTVDISPTLSERVRLTQMHASQMKMLFGDIANIEKEIRNYAHRVGTMGKPRERFWSSHDALNHRSN